MQKTNITLLLDRTGSMMACKDATIEAFNAYLAGLKAGDQTEVDALEFTFLQFDSSMGIYKVCVAEDVRKVELLNHRSYECLASTPLVDCAYKTIKAVEEALRKRDDQPKVVICFQTDGHENASTEYTMDQLNQLIKEKVALGWKFNFMGASIDAYDQAQKMGVPTRNTVSYNKNNAVQTQSIFAENAGVTRSYAKGATGDTSYSMKSRADAGDVHAESYLNADGTEKKPPAPSASTRTTPTPPVAKPTAEKSKLVDDITL